MESLFTFIKGIHLITLIVSITGFITRFVLQLKGSHYMQKRWIKIVPHINDTLLLAAAVGLVMMMQVNPFTTPWLAEKLVGLTLYILLGMAAMRWAKTIRAKIIAGGAAVIVFAYIVYVAKTKAPFILFV